MRREADQLHISTRELVQQLKEETIMDDVLLTAVRALLATVEPRVLDQPMKKGLSTVQRTLEELQDEVITEATAAETITSVVAILSRI